MLAGGALDQGRVRSGLATYVPRLVGGITTIEGLCRRVAGVSGVYGRKTPRVLAQSAVDLGEMRVTWGVWGVFEHSIPLVIDADVYKP